MSLGKGKCSLLDVRKEEWYKRRGEVKSDASITTSSTIV